MFVKYVQIDGRPVSVQWYALLTDIRRSGVSFHVNQGHRTIAEQWYFYRLYRSGKGNLAAFPSPFAPHVRTGRFDHAIDFNNAEGVRQAAARRGITLTRTVVGEEWHLEANASELNNYYKKHSNSFKTLKRGSVGRRVIRVKRILHRKWGLEGYSVNLPGYGKNFENAVQRFQKRHCLKQDGQIGPATWKVINS